MFSDSYTNFKNSPIIILQIEQMLCCCVSFTRNNILLNVNNCSQMMLDGLVNIGYKKSDIDIRPQRILCPPIDFLQISISCFFSGDSYIQQGHFVFRSWAQLQMKYMLLVGNIFPRVMNALSRRVCVCVEPKQDQRNIFLSDRIYLA